MAVVNNYNSWKLYRIYDSKLRTLQYQHHSYDSIKTYGWFNVNKYIGIFLKTLDGF